MKTSYKTCNNIPILEIKEIWTNLKIIGINCMTNKIINGKNVQINKILFELLEFFSGFRKSAISKPILKIFSLFTYPEQYEESTKSSSLYTHMKKIFSSAALENLSLIQPDLIPKDLFCKILSGILNFAKFRGDNLNYLKFLDVKCEKIHSFMIQEKVKFEVGKTAIFNLKTDKTYWVSLKKLSNGSKILELLKSLFYYSLRKYLFRHKIETVLIRNMSRRLENTISSIYFNKFIDLEVSKFRWKQQIMAFFFKSMDINSRFYFHYTTILNEKFGYATIYPFFVSLYPYFYSDSRTIKCLNITQQQNFRQQKTFYKVSKQRLYICKYKKIILSRN